MVISHKVHIVDIVLLGTSCAPYTILPSSAFSHSGAPRAREARACGRSPIAKEIYPSQKIW